MGVGACVGAWVYGWVCVCNNNNIISNVYRDMSSVDYTQNEL